MLVIYAFRDYPAGDKRLLHTSPGAGNDKKCGACLAPFYSGREQQA
jgi:hypothetical protein